MPTARELYASLDDAEKSCIQRQQLKATRPLASWRQTIDRLAAFDAVGDAERDTARKWLTAAWVFLGAAVVFGVFATNAHGRGPKVIAAVVGGVAVVAVLVCWVRHHRLASIDVPDGLRNFVGPLFVMLSEDLDPQRPVTLDIDLNRSRASHREGGARKVPIPAGVKAGFFSAGITKIIEHHRQIPCFHLEGDLADGSHMVVDVKDYERVRTVHKKNARGKHKSKTKTKTQRVIEAQLTVANKSYALSKNTPKGDSTGAKVKAGEKRSTVRAKKAVVVNADRVHDTDAILRTLAGLFQRAQPVGTGASTNLRGAAS